MLRLQSFTELCQGSVSKESKSTEETDFSTVSQTGDVTDIVCHHFSLRVTLVQIWFSVFIRK